MSEGKTEPNWMAYWAFAPRSSAKCRRGSSQHRSFEALPLSKTRKASTRSDTVAGSAWSHRKDTAPLIARCNSRRGYPIHGRPGDRLDI